jgi:hypothetical protein
MAETSKPSPVKLIVGVIFASEGILIKARERLKKKFGPVDFQGPVIPFDYTRYYEKQMGPNLRRQFFSFQRLIDPAKLAQIKLYTNRLESSLSPGSGQLPARKINLDPGYISASKLVLATCKNYSHRIYLDRGIFAEVTLRFEKRSFTAWPWTYPDYKSKDYIQNFNTIREIYLKRAKKGCKKA